MATPDTQLIVSIETVLKNLDRTLKGLSRVEKQLRTIASISPSRGLGFDKTAAAAERLRIKQERLVVQSQELSNRQERARQTTERLTLSQQRLERATERQTRATAASGKQQDAHVQAFRASEKQIKELSTSLQRVGNIARGAGQGLASLGATLSLTLTAPLIAFGAGTVQAAVSLDSLRRGLTAIVGSAQEAAVQLRRLTEIAKLPGIGFEEAIQGSIRLQAVGFSAQDAEKALIQFSNAVALTGGGREELARITVQLGQLAAKGKVLAQDLKPIIEAAPAVGQALLQAFGTVNSEDIQELGLSSKQFLDILVSQLSELPRAAGGARNAFDNFRDAVFRASATVGEVLLPAVTRVIEVLEPIITTLAEGFAALPGPIQTVVVVVGALAAAVGPVVFITGQLVLGVGRLIVAYGQLQPILARTTLSFSSLTTAMTGTSAATATAGKALAVRAAGFLGVAGVVIGLVAVLANLLDSERELAKVDIQAAKARTAQTRAAEDELKFLEGLAGKVALTADEQRRLQRAYDALEGPAKGRVRLIEDEAGKLQVLIQAQRDLIQQKAFAQQAEARVAIEGVTRALEAQAKAQNDLAAAQERFNRAEEFARLDVALDKRQQLVRAELRRTEAANAATQATEDEAKALEQLGLAVKDIEALAQATEKTTEEIVRQGIGANKTEAEIRVYIETVNNFIQSQQRAEVQVDETTKAILKQLEGLKNLSREPAVVIAKGAEESLQSVLAFIRETTNSTREARDALRNYIELFPVLGKAVERQGGISEVIDKLFSGKGRAKSGTSLRNAQEALAEALADVAEAEALKELAINEAKNESLLRANNKSFRDQLISYQEFLEERARLTSEHLDIEIKQQAESAAKFRAAQVRLLDAARKTGIPEAERARRRAQAAEAQEKAIKAETKLAELEARQAEITDALQQDLAEARRQQLEDVIKLEVEYGKLQGRIEDALKTETLLEFGRGLEQLARSQDRINKQLQIARQLRQADRVKELEQRQQQNQRETDAITNTTRLRDAQAELTAAAQLVTNAKERQKKLEEEINFEVQFRGLSEEAAIQKRLEGEARLQRSLQLSRAIITDTIQKLTNLGVTPPPELRKFVNELAQEIKGLGELPFSEQFRLAEKEFNRLNDERLRRIADIERAVRNRDIAEAEGRILIRKINGEYVADLEAQLELLKRIAELSGQETLKRQAADTGETVKDAKDKLADFNKQLRAGGIDAFRDSFIQFFSDLRDQTTSAAEDFLAFLDRISARITDLVAENLADKLLESVFGTAGKEGGILAAIGRLFGIGGEAEVDVAHAAAGGVRGATGGAAAATALTTGATTAAAALTTGGATAGTAMSTGGITAGTSLSTGGVTASATLVSAITGAAAAFSAAVIAAGAAFAAAVAAASAAQVGIGAAGAATGDFLSAKPGGRIVKIAEAGHAEAVLTTDPRYAARQARILMRFLKETRGLAGRFHVPELAEGAFVSPRQAEMNLLNSIDRQPLRLSRIPETAIVAPDRARNIRFIFLDDQRQIRNWMNSPEGDEVFVEKVVRNAPLIRRIK